MQPTIKTKGYKRTFGLVTQTKKNVKNIAFNSFFFLLFDPSLNFLISLYFIVYNKNRVRVGLSLKQFKGVSWR